MSLNRSGLRVVLPSHLARGPSPTPIVGDTAKHHRLQVPGGGGENNSTAGSTVGGGADIFCEGGGLWGEEDSEVIRSCGALSAALGLQKSFSCSDIVGTDLTSEDGGAGVKAWVSEVNIFVMNSRMESFFPARLDAASRSCSTWVAVGDVASTSQLPSPQARAMAGEGENAPTITAADFIRSVNKKVRQNYIKKRLLTTYKALQRFSASSLNVDSEGMSGLKQLEAGGITLVVPGHSYQTAQDLFKMIKKEIELSSPHTSTSPKLSSSDQTKSKEPQKPTLTTTPAVPTIATVDTSSDASPKKVVSISMSAKDIERDRGRALSKYERHMMIFDWLQALDETPYDLVT